MKNATWAWLAGKNPQFNPSYTRRVTKLDWRGCRPSCDGCVEYLRLRRIAEDSLFPACWGPYAEDTFPIGVGLLKMRCKDM